MILDSIPTFERQKREELKLTWVAFDLTKGDDQKMTFRKLVLIFALLPLFGCTKIKEEKLLASMKANEVTPEKLAARAESQPNFENEIEAGLAFSLAGDHDRALLFFERAKVRSPDAPVALNNVCSEFNSLRRWKPASENCRLAVAKAPEFQLAKNNLRIAEEQLAKQMTLVQELASASQKMTASKRLPSQIDLGLEYYKMGDYDKAVEIWKGLKPSDPKTEVIVLNNLGSAFILQRKFSNAREQLLKAKSLEPQNSLVLNNLRWLEQSEGKIQ